jgi:uncharacterized protein
LVFLFSGLIVNSPELVDISWIRKDCQEHHSTWHSRNSERAVLFADQVIYITAETGFADPIHPSLGQGSPMNDLHYSDSEIRNILNEVKTIAVVGASANWKRPSFFAMKYMQSKGYRMIPVNPGQAGKEILGEMCYATLADIPEDIDMVDVFRNSHDAFAVTEQAIDINAKVVWMQLSVRNDEAATLAEAAGLKVVMDRCPKIEYSRLFGELGWSGINTGIISSKRRKAGRK